MTNDNEIHRAELSTKNSAAEREEVIPLLKPHGALFRASAATRVNSGAKSQTLQVQECSTACCGLRYEYNMRQIACLSARRHIVCSALRSTRPSCCEPCNFRMHCLYTSTRNWLHFRFVHVVSTSQFLRYELLCIASTILYSI